MSARVSTTPTRQIHVGGNTGVTNEVAVLSSFSCTGAGVSMRGNLHDITLEHNTAKCGRTRKLFSPAKREHVPRHDYVMLIHRRGSTAPMPSRAQASEGGQGSRQPRRLCHRRLVGGATRTRLARHCRLGNPLWPHSVSWSMMLRVSRFPCSTAEEVSVWR